MPATKILAQAQALLGMQALAQGLLLPEYKNFTGRDIMYLGPAFLFGAFACLFFVPGFLDIPLGTLTVRQMISETMFLLFMLISLAALARSIEFDPVWPWRPEFRRLMQRLLRRT